MPIPMPLNAHWHTHSARLQELPVTQRSWLTDSGSLTLRLKQCWPADFQLELLQQRWGRPTVAERQKLNLPPRRWALIREVLLSAGGQPRVFARTLIPERTLRHGCPQLRHLGARALGETLFNQRQLARSPFEFGTLSAEQLNPVLGCNYSPEPLWGRRSLFYLKGEPLLVQEFFLPQGA